MQNRKRLSGKSSGRLRKRVPRRMGRKVVSGRKSALDSTKAKPSVGDFIGRSGLERKFANFLQESGLSFLYESRRIPYIIQRQYVPDFELSNGILIETKGRFTSEDRSKIRRVVQDDPKLVLILVFSRPYNTLSKKSRTTYGDWCTKNSIVWFSFDGFVEFITKNRKDYVNKLLERHRTLGSK